MPQQIAQGGTITLNAVFENGSYQATDPTNPLISILDPTGTTIVSNATPDRIGLGMFEYDYPVANTAMLGAYAVRWTGLIDGNPVVAQDDFTVVAPSQLLPVSTSPQVSPWCLDTDVSTDARVSGVILPDAISYANIAQGVSELLFKMSGSRWSGLRTDRVRPHRLNDDCVCDMSGVGGMWYGWGWTGIGGWWNRLFPEGWGCACVGGPEITLAGPVTNVVSILVDGVALVQGQDFDMYDNRRLVRLADPTIGSILSWPCCQRLSTPLGTQGTWEITYQHGQGPPEAGRLAAIEWCVQTARRLDTSATRLPNRAQSVQRHGVNVTVEANNLLHETGWPGYEVVDQFLNAYNPHGLRRRARVFSPDTIQDAIVSSTQP